MRFYNNLIYSRLQFRPNYDAIQAELAVNMIWNPSIECMDREQLREIQSRRLVKMAEYVYHNTPFYRKKFQEMGLEPGDIKSIDDIVKLPFTNKLDLRDNYPFGLAAVPMSQIVRIHASSGTTGKPVVVLYTRKDLAMWAEAISRAFTAYGATKDDIFQVAYGYGLFTGGLGAHDGATNIGASVIPISSGNTQKQITLMHDFGSTILCCTPSYGLFLGEAMNESEWPRDEFKLRVGAFGAEPWTEEMRRKLEPPSASRPTTSTDSLRLPVRAWAMSVNVSTAPTSTKTISIPRYSTPTRASRCLRAQWAN